MSVYVCVCEREREKKKIIIDKRNELYWSTLIPDTFEPPVGLNGFLTLNAKLSGTRIVTLLHAQHTN